MRYDAEISQLANSVLADEPRAGEEDRREFEQQVQNLITDFFCDLERRGEAMTTRGLRWAR